MSNGRNNARIAGKVVAITGGARGIGLATARELRERGALVAIGDLDKEHVLSVVEEHGLGFGGALDVTDPDSFAVFLGAVEEALGPIDVLVNNAGIMPTGALIDEPDEMTRRTIDVDLFGVIVGSKLALRRMTIRGSGHIINIASLAGTHPTAGLTTYCAAKIAVLGFTEAAGREHRSAGVRFSAVLPTFTKTELIAGTPVLPGMLAQPADVARAVASLIRRPRARVTVTRLAALLVGAEAFMPKALGEFIQSRLGVDRVFVDGIDHRARKDYEDRIRGGADRT